MYICIALSICEYDYFYFNSKYFNNRQSKTIIQQFFVIVIDNCYKQEAQVTFDQVPPENVNEIHLFKINWKCKQFLKWVGTTNKLQLIAADQPSEHRRQGDRQSTCQGRYDFCINLFSILMHHLVAFMSYSNESILRSESPRTVWIKLKNFGTLN